MESPTSPPLSVFLPATENRAAANTTADPTNSSRNPNHLKNQTLFKRFCWTEVHFVGPLVPCLLDFA